MRTGGGLRKALSCTAWRRDGRRSLDLQGLAKGGGSGRGHNQGLAIERRNVLPPHRRCSAEWNRREALEIKAWRDGHDTGRSIKGSGRRRGRRGRGYPRQEVSGVLPSSTTPSSTMSPIPPAVSYPPPLRLVFQPLAPVPLCGTPAWRGGLLSPLFLWAVFFKASRAYLPLQPLGITASPAFHSPGLDFQGPPRRSFSLLSAPSDTPPGVWPPSPRVRP
jgi:hypothetical protein